jgi:hypothetical protein
MIFGLCMLQLIDTAQDTAQDPPSNGTVKTTYCFVLLTSEESPNRLLERHEKNGKPRSQPKITGKKEMIDTVYNGLGGHKCLIRGR